MACRGNHDALWSLAEEESKGELHLVAFAGSEMRIAIPGDHPEGDRKTGPLFYHWIVSINTALVAAILLILDQISRGYSWSGA
jgi:hypothetical protein